MMEFDKQDLISEFKKIFGYSEGVDIFFAPGRVNLIGEHTDYNGGYVFPCALDFGTFAVAKKRSDNKFRFYSMNFVKLGVQEFSLDKLINEPRHDWANYPKGVIKTFIDNGHRINFGLDILFFGNIPNGAGLSSSASIEVLTGTLLKEIFELNIDMIDIVKISQKAENNFMGVNCGIMDQFAVGMGKKDNAILLDCNTLKYKYAPIKLSGISIVISNTNKRRGLGDSKYNERRNSCEQAVNDINLGVNKKLKYLCELNIEEFNILKKFVKSEENIKRATHAISENIRAIQAVENLEKGNLEKFGQLMNDSHISLRDDYEVTGKELDSLVESAWGEKGTLGSRMTGAGFGGCTVSLVKDEFIDSFVKNVGKKYSEKTGLAADFYVAKVGDGARKL
ncbi:MAG: galactokinase [Fusobacteriaceae bacterium]